MKLHLDHPNQTIVQLVTFIRSVYQQTAKTTAVIAVSGGIDSALSLTLLTQAMSSSRVLPVFLPYGEQDMEDAFAIARYAHIPENQWHVINIKPVVDTFATQLQLSEGNAVRLGNVMARTRMIVLYDLAKKLNALVCGTENKSEHYLGYFTRFGDAASDLEPICNVYKTQVRQLATHLEFPASILKKPPSAGLWSGQTDETEMGFTYEEADKVLAKWEETGFEEVPATGFEVIGVSPEVVEKVVEVVKQMEFKRKTPYVPT